MQHVTVQNSRRVEVTSHYVATFVDIGCGAASGSGNLERCESPLDQHEGVTARTDEAWTAVAVLADDVAAGVDAAVVFREKPSGGWRDRGEIALTVEKQLDSTTSTAKSAQYLAARVDAPCVGLDRSGYIEDRELIIAEQ